MVGKSSACIGHSQETKHSVVGDHSEMVKLKLGQASPYPNVLMIINDALKSASEKYDADAQANKRQLSSSTAEREKKSEAAPRNESDDDLDELSGCDEELEEAKVETKSSSKGKPARKTQSPFQSSNIPSREKGPTPKPTTSTPNKKANNSTRSYNAPDSTHNTPRTSESTPSKTPYNKGGPSQKPSTPIQAGNGRGRGQAGRGTSQMEPKIMCFRCKHTFASKKGLNQHLDDLGHR